MVKESVLIVEDDPDIVELLQYTLEREGHPVLVARNGEKGLSEAKRRKPGLIVLDLMLPGLDGLEVCRALKGEDSTRSIPVVMLTAKGEESDVILGLENHDFVKNIDYLVRILDAIDSKWLGVIWDSCNLYPTSEPYKELARIAPFAVTAQIKVMTRLNGEEVENQRRRDIDVVRLAHDRSDGVEVDEEDDKNGEECCASRKPQPETSVTYQAVSPAIIKCPRPGSGSSSASPRGPARRGRPGTPTRSGRSTSARSRDRPTRCTGGRR